MSRYQKGKTNLDFTEARDSEWHWHQLGHMQVCTSLQTNNHASTPPLSFLQAGCPSCRPTNSVKALKANRSYDKLTINRKIWAQLSTVRALRTRLEQQRCRVLCPSSLAPTNETSAVLIVFAAQRPRQLLSDEGIAGSRRRLIALLERNSSRKRNYGGRRTVPICHCQTTHGHRSLVVAGFDILR